MLHIDSRTADGITTLDLAGELTLGPGDARLRDEVTSLMCAGLNKIIVNLRRISKIDAAGLGVLTLVLIRCRISGGKAVLLNIESSKIDTSEALELDTEFEAYHDENSAINSFFPDRAINHCDILTFVEQEEERPTAEDQNKVA